MVFESVVVELLNRFLKPYVKKLDTSQLKVAVWKGKNQLELIYQLIMLLLWVFSMLVLFVASKF